MSVPEGDSVEEPGGTRLMEKLKVGEGGEIARGEGRGGGFFLQGLIARSSAWAKEGPNPSASFVKAASSLSFA